MAMIHLKIVTPQGKFFDADAQQVMVRTTGGDVAILPHHIDYSAALAEAGQARVVEVDGTVRLGEVQLDLPPASLRSLSLPGRKICYTAFAVLT